MRLNAPKKITWWISTILAVLGLIGEFLVPAMAAYAFPLVLIGFVLLWLGTFVKGL